MLLVLNLLWKTSAGIRILSTYHVTLMTEMWKMKIFMYMYILL